MQKSIYKSFAPILFLLVFLNPCSIDKFPSGKIANLSQVNYPVDILWEPRDAGEAFLDIGNRENSLNYYRSSYLISSPPPIKWTGAHNTCDPGKTNTELHRVILRRINYFRAMAGVPDDIVFSEKSNLMAQAAALLMSVNKDLDHTPLKTWRCLSDVAAQGAGSSDLCLRMNGLEAITGYIRDPGDNNYDVGHRRWILYPQTQIMGTGDIPAAESYPASNALVVFDDYMWTPRPDTRDGFVAWPPPGYVPYTVVFTRWSFSYPGADFSQATVRMSREGVELLITQEPFKDGYGENTIVWQLTGMDSGADWPVPIQDIQYEILIENVTIEAQAQDFSYQVIVFDPNS